MVEKDRGSHELDRIQQLCVEHNVRFASVPKVRLDGIHLGGHQGVAAKLFSAGFVEYEPLLELGKQSPLPVLVALDQVLDPGNIGVLARTLHGLGGGGLVLPKHGCAHLGPGAMKSSAGVLMRLPVAKVTNLARALEQAKEAGYTVVAASREGENAMISDFPMPMMLVLGSEESGIRPGVLERCERTMSLPLMNSVESYNVAQAGAMLLALGAKSMF